MYYKNQLLHEGPNDPITFTDLLVIATSLQLDYSKVCPLLSPTNERARTIII